MTDYIVNSHGFQRHGDGSPVYRGSSERRPVVRFEHVDVPILQVLSDGDISDPNRPVGRAAGIGGSSDDPADSYRLYELAGVAHMGPVPAL